MGLVAAIEDVTRIRVLSVNTGARIEAVVETPGGKVRYDGSAAVDVGEAIPNVNDGFAGGAPDLGAYERGERALSLPRLDRLAQFYRAEVAPAICVPI